MKQIPNIVVVIINQIKDNNNLRGRFKGKYYVYMYSNILFQQAIVCYLSNDILFVLIELRGKSVAQRACNLNDLSCSKASASALAYARL